jgi:hypothetical protein
MTQHTDRRMRYPHHWPFQVPRLPGTRQQQPTGPAAPAETPSTAASAGDGELATAPWLGLHYRTEDV